MSVSACRRSRFCVHRTWSAVRCPFVPYQDHFLLPAGRGRSTIDILNSFFSRRNRLRGFPASPSHGGYGGYGWYHTGTQVRQLASLTIRTGLAELSHTSLLFHSAFFGMLFS